MEHTPIVARLGLWRLTRHPVARQLYDWTADRGLFFAQLDRYERKVCSVPEHNTERPASLTLSVSPASEGLPEQLLDGPLAPDDSIVRAELHGDTVGYCCLSDRPVFVPELRRRIAFDGSYLWRLYVTPAERGQGIGTSLVEEAIETTRTAIEADRIIALLAPDNVPSRRAFDKLGFQPTTRYTSTGVGRRAYHRRRTLG